MFAPKYSPPPGGRPPSPPRSRPPPPPRPEVEDADPYAPRTIAAQPSTGDEAYARRAGLPPVASGDDAYARRVALSQGASGDDAYARRAALSQQPAPTPISALPPFPPTPREQVAPTLTGSDDSVREMPSAGMLAGVAVQPASTTGSSAPALPVVSAVPSNPAGASENAGAPGAPANLEFAKLLEEKKRAAEAVAARLRALAPGAAPAPLPIAEEE
jgi:splicing factor 45